MTDSKEFGFSALTEPFHSKDVEWRVGSSFTNWDKSALRKKDANRPVRGQVFAYLNARTIMDRLDEVVGAHNWKDEYTLGPAGKGVLCTLYIRINGEWIGKQDGADGTDLEATKGSIADAFKRAAVKWGIGRYLYKLPTQWVDLTIKEGYTLPQLDKDPELPEWAKREGDLKKVPSSETKSVAPAPTVEVPLEIKPTPVAEAVKPVEEEDLIGEDIKPFSSEELGVLEEKDIPKNFTDKDKQGILRLMTKVKGDRSSETKDKIVAYLDGTGKEKLTPAANKWVRENLTRF